MGNWNEKNKYLRDSWERSILGINDGNTQWRFDFTKYLVNITKLNGLKYFWELIPMLRFIKSNEHIAYTDEDCNIFLNAPSNMVPKDYDKWEFIYYHECLHQMYETFKVGEQIKKDKGVYNHKLLNVASDCVINDELHNGYHMDYPTDGLVTPEYIKDKYQIEYDRKNDDQYGLYMKMLDSWEKMKDDPVIQQSFDDLPEVDAKINGGSSERVKTKKLPSSDDFKSGSKAARHSANEILQKYSESITKQPNGKISSKDAIESLTKAVEEIKKALVGKPNNKNNIKEFFHNSVLSSFEFILEAEENGIIDTKYSTFEQGWDYALDDVLQKIEQCINSLSGTGGGGGGGTSNPGGEINEVPDNDPTEEAPFLPKVENSDKDDSNDSDNDSDSNDSDKDGDSNGSGKDDSNDSDKDSDSNDSDIDSMSGDEAVKQSEKDAKEAQDAADKAQEAANKAEENAKKAKEKSDSKSEADKAQEAADKAKSEADKAQEAADKAKSEAEAAKQANDSGNEDEAKEHAKNANEQAKLAKDHAKNTDELKNDKPEQPHGPGIENDKKNIKDIEIDWDAKNRDAGLNEELVKKIKDFNKKHIGEMSSDEAKNIIRKFSNSIDSSSLLGDFVKKCITSSTKRKDGIIVKTNMEKLNRSWGTQFSEIIKNTVRQRVGKKLNEWEKTYKRANRRQGIVHDGDIIQKGKMRKKDRLTISVAFYIDCSTSMSNEKIEKLFKFAYKLDSYLQRKYRRNPVVDGCVFDYYEFTNGVKRIIPPQIPTRNGGTDDLDLLLNHIIRETKDHMINVIMTDGRMSITPSSIKTQLDELAGNVVFITENHSITSELDQVKKLCGDGIEKCGKKFEYIVVDGLNLTAKDFEQI